MFEKITSARDTRAPWTQSWGVPASVAAHVVLAAGIASVPLRANPAPGPEEVVTYMWLPSPPDAPDLPPPDAAPAPESASAARGDDRDAASEAEVKKPLPGVPDLELASPDEAAAGLPEVAPAVAAAAGVAGRDVAAALIRAMLPATPGVRPGVAVVAAEELAELPRMVNRGAISRVLSRDYPRRLEWRGITGEVVVAFIIGTDGLVELESVHVLSASHPEFVEPTLKGIERMRFRPARLGGALVRVRTTMPVRWTLPEG